MHGTQLELSIHLDDGDPCKTINQAACDLALSSASPAVLARFQTKGRPLVMVADGDKPHVSTYFHKPKRWETQSSSFSWWNWQGSWFLKIQRVRKEVSQVLSERCDLFLAVFDKNLRKRLSRIQFMFQIHRLQLTSAYCN